MSTSTRRSDVPEAAAWPAPLRLTAPAVPSQVHQFRRALAWWLHSDDLAPDTVEDVVLAASEALENCCDHAFADTDHVGTMSLDGRELHDRIVITVLDDGHWQPAGDGPTCRRRGLEMIRALVDDVELHRDDHGTRVTLSQRHTTGPSQRQGPAPD